MNDFPVIIKKNQALKGKILYTTMNHHMPDSLFLKAMKEYCESRQISTY